MRTLSHWEGRLTSIPSRLECREMRLLSALAHEAPVFEGPGYIDIKSSTHIEFTMFATSRNTGDALRRLNHLQEDPHDPQNRLLLQATDYQGTQWHCGRTVPHLKGLPLGLLLAGELDSLLTHASGPWVATDSSVELIFHPKLYLPMDTSMVTVATVDGEEIQRRHSAGRQTLQVLGSEIRFFYPPTDDSLWVTATTSNELPHPYADSWLSGPLRILLGQFISPRLVARNFGNGTADVSLRPSPRRYRNSGVAALIEEHPVGSHLWGRYAELLTLIASARDENGHPFETHPLVRYYEEVILATQGSRWILCMTLASAVEGLVRLLDDKPTGDLRVENRLKAMESQGVVTAQNRVSWRQVRHAVLHGQLVSPWSTRDEDQRILDIADLLRRLTRHLIQRPQPIGPP